MRLVDEHIMLSLLEAKKKKKIKKKECNSSGGLPQTLRGTKDEECDRAIMTSLLQESDFTMSRRFTLLEDMAGVTAPEGPVVKCILITEGLGNRYDMHYYGPECIQSGAALFEGKPCFVDHQGKMDQQERPERTIRDKCGYFKNVKAEPIDGRLGLTAELHYDLSETGRMAYDKACTAIHYKSEFASQDEYIGLSIAADGELVDKVMPVDGEVLDVKYVTRFTNVGSVDEVTSPARGGRFVQVVSSGQY